MKGFLTLLAAVSALIPAVSEAAEPDLSLKTVVLDAGHGGKDPGCVSPDGKTYEKNIVLRITGLLKEKIAAEYPDVKVLETRPKDVFIPLIDRPKFATRNDAGLFISVHVNAQERGNSANGYSIHLLGQSKDVSKDTYAFNMNVCQRENSVIRLEDNYSTTYKGLLDDAPETAIFLNLMHTAYREQSLLFAQSVDKSLGKEAVFRRSHGIMLDNFAVLRLATMPAVLLELGFITNPGDLSTLRDDSKTERIASALFEAFKEYKTMYDASVKVGSKPEEKPAGDNTGTAAASGAPENPAAGPAPVQVADSVLFGSQIFAGKNLILSGDPKFLGYEPTVVNTGEIYKYIIGTSSNLEEAKAENRKIREKYPQAFVVRISGGKLSRP